MEALAAVGALVLSALAFIFGKAFGESEKILVEKRRVYEEFLRRAPKPNDAYASDGAPFKNGSQDNISDLVPVILFYGGPTVLQAANEYISAFSSASAVLTLDSPPLHDHYKLLARAHNNLILEMRRDAFAMSAFAFRGKSRLSSK